MNKLYGWIHTFSENLFSESFLKNFCAFVHCSHNTWISPRARICIIGRPGTGTQGYEPQLWSTHQLGWSARISTGKGWQHWVLFREVIGCVGFQRERVFFQGHPLLQPLCNRAFFSKQEPCSISQASAAILWAQVKQLRARRVHAAMKTPMRGLARCGLGQNTRFPTSCKQKSTQREAHYKNTHKPIPTAQPPTRSRLGRKSKDFPFNWL